MKDTEFYHNFINGKCSWCGLMTSDPRINGTCIKTLQELKKQAIKRFRKEGIRLIKGNKIVDGK